MFVCHPYIFFGELTVKVFGPFFNWLVVFLLLSFKSCVCTLGNIPFSDMYFANIFSKSVTCLFILLVVHFLEQKFLILMKSSL